VLVVKQLGGHLRRLHPAAGILVELEELIAVLQRGHGLVQGRVVVVGRRLMLKADDVGRRAVELDVDLVAFEARFSAAMPCT
jgi:hypothetical protein